MNFLKALFVVLTLGWDFPVIKWWLARSRVVARRERRREALKIVGRGLWKGLKILGRVVIWPVKRVVRFVVNGR